MNDTQNYHLPQFEETDRIHHDDFNAAFAAIDAALAEKPFVIGSYTGNDKTEADGGQHITLGFRPRFVILSAGWNGQIPCYFYIFGEGMLARLSPDIRFTDTGFYVCMVEQTESLTFLNAEPMTYSYIAFR